MATKTTVIPCRTSDGRKVEILKIERTREIQTLDGVSEMDTLPEYRTAGSAVNVNDDGSFEIVQTGEIVWPE